MTPEEKMRDCIDIADTRIQAADRSIDSAASNAFSLQELILAVEKLSTVVDHLLKRRADPKRPDRSSTEVLDCGCKITKGYRCPIHNQP